jgi:thiol-disulfide isomerase/thioredoxin
VGVLLACLLAVGAAACGHDPNSIAAQAQDGSRKGYVSGDGSIETIAVSKRGSPVQLTGRTLDGSSWSVSQAAGKVVVLNVWASWCPPCEAEAPELRKAADALRSTGKQVAFMGVDTRDNPASGAATAKRHGLPYPSLDDQSGTMILALQGKALYPPTTLVLDRNGRIASRVAGQVTAATLTGLVDDVLAEK